MAVRKSNLKTKKCGKARELGVSKKKSVAVVDINEVRRKYMLMWADPTEVRSDEEIAKQLGVDSSQLAAWQFDPSFYVPAAELFQRNLPVLRAQVLRKISQQALGSGSGRGMRTLAEMLGLVKGKGDTNVFNLFGAGGNGSNQRLKDMSDEELEQELERMATIAYPTDVVMQQGKVLPARKVIDVEYEDIGPNRPNSGHDDSQTAERVPSLTPDGEGQEDGS